MRIAINTRLLLPGKLDGIGWFTYESVRRIVCSHPEHEYFFLFDRKPAGEFLFTPQVHPLVLCPQARHPVLWYLFFEHSVMRALKKNKIDLFLSTDGWISLRSDVPTLTVIHDINFEHASDYLRPSHQRYMKRFFPRFAKQATRIATVSEYSKRDISDIYQVPMDKIDVVYDGAHALYQPVSEEVKEDVRARYTQGAPYFIFVSTIIKRKNLTNTLLAFDQFKEIDTQGTKLVVVGTRVWWQDELKQAYDNMRHSSDVIFIGRAEATQLANLLASAIALVYVSYFEGFGIPILESFYAETPVISSNRTSLPEVAGDAALLVEPADVHAIAEAMRSVATDADLSAQLIERGRRQREQFSWDRTAELLWNAMMKTIEEPCEKQS